VVEGGRSKHEVALARSALATRESKLRSAPTISASSAVKYARGRLNGLHRERLQPPAEPTGRAVVMKLIGAPSHRSHGQVFPHRARWVPLRRGGHASVSDAGRPVSQPAAIRVARFAGMSHTRRSAADVFGSLSRAPVQALTASFLFPARGGRRRSMSSFPPAVPSSPFFPAGVRRRSRSSAASAPARLPAGHSSPQPPYADLSLAEQALGIRCRKQARVAQARAGKTKRRRSSPSKKPPPSGRGRRPRQEKKRGDDGPRK